jgi:predicted aspartyl protease
MRWSDVQGEIPSAARLAALGIACDRRDTQEAWVRVDDISLIERAAPGRIEARSIKLWSRFPGQRLAASIADARVDWLVQRHRGTPIVGVRIPGHSPLRFLLDTGASLTALGSGWAQELPLTNRGVARVTGLTGTADVQLVEVPRLGIETDEAELLLHDITAVVAPSLPPARPPLAGILAPHDLPGGLLTVDLDAHRILLEPGSLPPADGEVIFDLTSKEEIIALLPFAGQPQPFLVDTGATGGLAVATGFAAGLRFRSEPREIGLDSTFTGDRVTLSARLTGRLIVGAVWIDDPVVSLVANDFGLLGVGVLEHFVLTLDLANRRLRLTPRAIGAIPSPPLTDLGITASPLPDGRRRVVHVSSATPASRAGLRKDDVVVAINGRRCETVSDDEWEEAQSHVARLVIEREGDRRELTLTPAVLIP